MKSKIILLFIIAALSALIFYGYPAIKSRYFPVEKKSIIADSEIKTESENTGGEINETNDIVFESASLKINVLPADCDNECSRFKKEDEVIYCKEVCGLSPSEEITEGSDACQNKSATQKEYCLKDLAIKNGDFKLCESIDDAGIEKACKNRITEDIMDAQQSSTP